MALHSHAGRWSVLVLSILLLLGEPVMLVANEVARPIRWLPPLCAAALVAGLVLQALGIRRLRALPHPWLGN